MARLGAAGEVSQGVTRQGDVRWGMARYGLAGTARPGPEGYGKLGYGKACKVRRGRQGAVRVCCGRAVCGEVRQGVAGMENAKKEV